MTCLAREGLTFLLFYCWQANKSPFLKAVCLVTGKSNKLFLSNLSVLFCFHPLFSYPGLYNGMLDRKRTFVHLRPTKMQISLRVRTVWSESSQHAFCIVKDAKFLQANNEYSNQTARMRRLVWVFVGRTCQKVRCLPRCYSNYSKNSGMLNDCHYNNCLDKWNHNENTPT